MHQEDGMPVSTQGLNDRLRSQTRTATSHAAPPPTLFRLPNLNPVSDNTTAAAAPVAENFLADTAPQGETTQRRFDSATTPAEPVQPSVPADQADAQPEIQSVEADAAKFRLFDEGDARVKAPAHASRERETEPYKRSLFEKAGSQTIVLGGLALLAGAAMLANQNREPDTLDAPIIEHQADSPWPANLGADPAVIARDSRLPASAGGGLDPETSPLAAGQFNPAEQAFANPANELAAPQQQQVSQTGDSDDSLHLGSYQRESNQGAVLTPLVDQSRQDGDATGGQNLQEPILQAPNEPFVPSGTYDSPGPNEIPVDPIPTPGGFSTGGNFSTSQTFSGGLGETAEVPGQQRSLRPEMSENLNPPDVSAAATADSVHRQPDTVSHLSAPTPAPAPPRPTVQLNRPTSPDGLRYSRSPLPIDWNRYIPQPGNAAEAQRPVDQTASPAPNSQTR